MQLQDMRRCSDLNGIFDTAPREFHASVKKTERKKEKKTLLSHELKMNIVHFHKILPVAKPELTVLYLVITHSNSFSSWCPGYMSSYLL